MFFKPINTYYVFVQRSTSERLRNQLKIFLIFNKIKAVDSRRIDLDFVSNSILTSTRLVVQKNAELRKQQQH